MKRAFFIFVPLALEEPEVEEVNDLNVLSVDDCLNQCSSQLQVGPHKTTHSH